MKKIIFAGLALLSLAGLFFACQKETISKEAAIAASTQETITSREEGICSYEVTINGAIDTYLCGTIPPPGAGKCGTCEGQYGRFVIDQSPVTRTMLNTVFAIENPTGITKSVGFTVTGAACSSSFNIAPGHKKYFKIVNMSTPAPSCCRVIEFSCDFSTGG